MREPALKTVPSGRLTKPEPLVEVEVELLTRLFGGGARPRTMDEVCWLRPPAVKSALRFWWRAEQGGRHPDLSSLYREEVRLFGGSARFGGDGQAEQGPGAVTVEALSTPPTKGLAPLDSKQGDALQIAYFSATEKLGNSRREGGEGAAGVLGAPGRCASVVVSCQEQDMGEAVKEALRLWLTLGGAGARTRRGAGAVGVRSSQAARELGLPADVEELEERLVRWAAPAKALAGFEGVFLLARTQAIFTGSPCPSAEEAQRVLLQVLREVRQKRPHPGNWAGPNGWGQSMWPEGDALRVLTGRHAKNHPPRDKLPFRGGYPRGVLGLPIVFHFHPKDRDEPGDHMLTAALPAGRGWQRIDRYASPLLLRPVRIWDGKSARYIPVAVVTKPTLPEEIRWLVEASRNTGAKANREPDSRRLFSPHSLQAYVDHVHRELVAGFENPPGSVRFQRLL